MLVPQSPRANRPTQLYPVGEDVGLAPAVDGADVGDHGFERVHLTADDALQPDAFET